MAAQIPPGHHRVRSYIRRNPTASTHGKPSGWLVLAGAVVAIWLWSQGGGQPETGERPDAPAPSVTAPQVVGR